MVSVKMKHDGSFQLCSITIIDSKIDPISDISLNRRLIEHVSQGRNFYFSSFNAFWMWKHT